jgi:hypothetical protein
MLQLIALFTLTLALIPMRACSGRVLEREGFVPHSLEPRAESRMLGTLRRDIERDRATAPRILERDRLVSRYTTMKRARIEAREGLAAGTHFTSRLRPGRPLSAEYARARYGLPIRPEVRERILLKRGTSVRMNKALGGKPGMGEITVVRPAPSTAVRAVRRIK